MSVSVLASREYTDFAKGKCDLNGGECGMNGTVEFTRKCMGANGTESPEHCRGLDVRYEPCFVLPCFSKFYLIL